MFAKNTTKENWLWFGSDFCWLIKEIKKETTLSFPVTNNADNAIDIPCKQDEYIRRNSPESKWEIKGTT